jgi:hypothetical protein
MSDDPDYFAEIARNMRKIAKRESRSLGDHALDQALRDERSKEMAKEVIEDMEAKRKFVKSPGVSVREIDNSAAPSPDKGVESSELVDPSKLPVQRHVGYIDPDTLQPAINPKLVNQGSTRRTSQHLLLPYF